MNAVDIALLCVGLFFVVRGMMKGLSGEIMSLVGTVGGFTCAIRFYGPFAAILMENFGLSLLASTILSMLAIFFLLFFGCAMIEMSLKKVLSGTNLTFTDKLLGAIVGLLKMYVISLLVLIGGNILAPVAGDAWMKESRVLAVSAFTYPAASSLLESAGLLPNVIDIQEEAKKYIMRQAGESILGGASGDLAVPGAGGLGLPGLAIPESENPSASGDTAP
jgi:membrane protein required for colicin V production